MSDQPQPVSPREICDFLSQVRARLGRSEPARPDEQVAFFERKVDLFTRIAAQSGDSEAYAAAAGARAQLAHARARAAQDGGQL